MVDTVTRQKSLSEQEQAGYYYARERRRSFNGKPELFGTHNFAIDRDNILIPSYFPNAKQPITIYARILIGTGAVNGNIVNLSANDGGGVQAGMRCYLINVAGDPYIGVAWGTNNDSDLTGGIEIRKAAPNLVADTAHELVYAFSPTGKCAVWLDGFFFESATITTLPNGDVMTVQPAADGSIGAGITNGEGTERGDNGSRVEPVNFSIAGTVTVFANQLPKQFPN